MSTRTLRLTALLLFAFSLACGRDPVEGGPQPASSVKPDVPDAPPLLGEGPPAAQQPTTPAEQQPTTPAEQPPVEDPLPNPITGVPAKDKRVDFIWVVDESGSMADDRAKLATAAPYFVQRALAHGLDLRIGVTGVMSPTGSHAPYVGKLCSAASSDPDDAGGADRFLDAGEVQTLAACLQNPPAIEQALEHPLTNAHAAIARHLPRAAADPTRLRLGARLVLIFFTDELSEELRQLVPDARGDQCVLDPPTQALVDQALLGEIAFLQQQRGRAYVIGGACNPACFGDVPHGLLALAAATGGGGFDICAATLEPALDKIIADVAALP